MSKKQNKSTRVNTRRSGGGKRSGQKGASKQVGSSRSSTARPLIVLGGMVVTLALLVGLIMHTMNGGEQSTTAGPDLNASQSGQEQSTDRASQSREMPPAPVEFDPPQIDFGDVLPNTEHRQTVQVRNTGNRTLEILTTNSSCPCTTTNLEAREILPGASVPFELVMDSEDNPGSRTVHGRILFRGYATARLPINVNVLDG